MTQYKKVKKWVAPHIRTINGKRVKVKGHYTTVEISLKPLRLKPNLLTKKGKWESTFEPDTPQEIKVREMVKDPNVSFDKLYTYLRDNEIGNWDDVNSEEIIKQYCTEMMNKGIHISHIVAALEKHPSEHDLYSIWLGNSMNTPTPINNKKDLVRELELK